ncbi:GNAT family N-acetyltransferase [Aliiglaciecola lipolytica]|uniref:N-acetyltransferase domain-containing protein n=1 Tax=Aliiglaciecola lipolytica E3 TaxID=1127673 RepID=K6X4V0_9ALTE|nr:GNAT family N-acetyltransferase [Aliiglaciecola lipolytica]GAC15659.1 hypothetical protein GLIP_3038 [Aliiglaciecola lipolytica E3]
MAIKIQKAALNQAASLTKLAMLSKSYWGYDAEFMQLAAQELLVTEQALLSPLFDYQIAINPYNVIEGFCALSFQPQLSTKCKASLKLDNADFETETIFELEALFVDPSSFRKGVGKALFKHAIDTAEQLNCNRILIQSDPYALDFYLKQGCEQIGLSQSNSIAGRTLPQLQFTL